MASPAHRFVFAVVAPVQRFLRLEAAAGLVLAFNAFVALVLANSSFGDVYQRVVHATIRLDVGSLEPKLSVQSLINDGLMTVFFAVAGMEIKRDVVTGELRSARRAALPLIAAAGGMLVPALIYVGFNPHGTSRVGWAIPTATDIAFALGCLSIVKRRIPRSLFVFLTALAIFDDLGAILIIAVAYGNAAHLPSLAVAAAITGLLIALARARIFRPWLYVLVGAALWVAVQRSGLHPALAGVIVGLAVPATGTQTLERLLHRLHGPVAFGIVPLFALANAGIVLNRGASLFGPVTLGVAAALVVGKCLGVLGAVAIAVRSNIAPLPSEARWGHIVGVALIAGIGFTMSIFVTGLAFPNDPDTAMSAKVGILTGSIVSALAGLAVLRLTGAPLRETGAGPQANVISG